MPSCLTSSSKIKVFLHKWQKPPRADIIYTMVETAPPLPQTLEHLGEGAREETSGQIRRQQDSSPLGSWLSSGGAGAVRRHSHAFPMLVRITRQETYWVLLFNGSAGSVEDGRNLTEKGYALAGSLRVRAIVSGKTQWTVSGTAHTSAQLAVSSPTHDMLASCQLTFPKYPPRHTGSWISMVVLNQLC